MTEPITTTAALVATGTVALSAFGEATIEIATKEFWKKVRQACEVIRLKLGLADDNPFDDPELLARIVDCSCEDMVLQQSLKTVAKTIDANSQKQLTTHNNELIESLQQRFLSKSQMQTKNFSIGDINNPVQSPIVLGDNSSVNYTSYSGSPKEI